MGVMQFDLMRRLRKYLRRIKCCNIADVSLCPLMGDPKVPAFKGSRVKIWLRYSFNNGAVSQLAFEYGVVQAVI